LTATANASGNSLLRFQCPQSVTQIKSPFPHQHPQQWHKFIIGAVIFPCVADVAR